MNLIVVSHLKRRNTCFRAKIKKGRVSGAGFFPADAFVAFKKSDCLCLKQRLRDAYLEDLLPAATCQVKRFRPALKEDRICIDFDFCGDGPLLPDLVPYRFRCIRRKSWPFLRQRFSIFGSKCNQPCRIASCQPLSAIEKKNVIFRMHLNYELDFTGFS
jgi:hypothetical protein